jgi:hypothetical protein
MADSSVRVQGPVSVQSESKYRVALELMQKITDYEEVKSESKDREYWLTLYSQCLSTVNGHAVQSTLQGSKTIR